MAKAIILVRISTARQEIETQKRELVEYALSDGFKKKDLIIIEGIGASAIKLNDVYMAEMDELYSTIENGGISAVYAWEISRIGRNEEILMRFKNFLIERKVQLVIKNPSLRLLNSDGSVNNGVELAFSLFATMSKQEMQVKKERFKRAKERNKAEGKYNGGRIKIGYRLDADKRFIEDKEKADIVRDIFRWYIEGQSLRKIYRRLLDLGIYTNTLHTNGKQVGVMLRDKAYVGDGIYPQIVSREVFDEVQRIMPERPQWHESSNVYFCKGIILDKVNMDRLVARLTVCSYYSCVANYTLNLNAMDYIAEYSADILLAQRAAKDAQQNLTDYALKVEQNAALIDSRKAQVEELERASMRAVEMNVKQPRYFPTERMEQVISQNERSIERLKGEIADMETENARMNAYIRGELTFIGSLKGLSDQGKKDMIDSVISRIEVTHLAKGHFIIDVIGKAGLETALRFEYLSHGNTLRVEQTYADGRRLDLSSAIRKNKRFGRKKYE